MYKTVFSLLAAATLMVCTATMSALSDVGTFGTDLRFS